jgi:glutamate synthase domain-containing protein 3
VVLYGATGGKVFIRGRAGERFAVRNSGAHTVVEGIGDHGCEYMTGGIVVVLGPTGRNFAAGMSGGISYVLDEDSEFQNRCNQDMVGLESVTGENDLETLRSLLEEHLHYTQSLKAASVLENWDDMSKKFIRVMPHDYKRVLEKHMPGDAHEEKVRNG